LEDWDLVVRAAKKSPRHHVRDHAMILLAYRHGMRASEVTVTSMQQTDSIAPGSMPLIARIPDR
jgi:site-specific recombinase XerD